MDITPGGDENDDTKILVTTTLPSEQLKSKPTAESVSQEIKQILTSRLRDVFTHMQTDAILAAVETTSEMVKRTVVEQAQRNTDLMSLPPELRNIIYAMLNASEADNDVSPYTMAVDDVVSPGPPYFTYDIPLKLHGARFSPITQVSRQVRSESRALYFTTTHFTLFQCVNSRDHGHYMLDTWLSLVGPRHAGMIKHFTIHFTQYDMPTLCTLVRCARIIHSYRLRVNDSPILHHGDRSKLKRSEILELYGTARAGIPDTSARVIVSNRPCRLDQVKVLNDDEEGVYGDVV